MCLRTPDFWYSDSIAARLAAKVLSPASFFYKAGYRFHQKSATPYKSRLPVICVGNLTAGGSGKTPVALAIMDIVKTGFPAANPCFLTRGYGREDKDCHIVSDRDNARTSGDEALLLARRAPVIVSADRKAGALLAEQADFGLIVMDDGLQNPGLENTLKLVVIDGNSGFGNGRLLPAGPLRVPLSEGLAGADAFILIGEDRHGNAKKLPAGKPLVRARLAVPESWAADRTASYIAFCGLGRPDKFRATIQEQGLTLAGWRAFPDHHQFTAADLERLDREAAAKNARLLTTEKDAVRLPGGFPLKTSLVVMPVEIVWESPEALEKLLEEGLSLP
jgi:tetraacyldisaccharide 4'-kinase